MSSNRQFEALAILRNDAAMTFAPELIAERAGPLTLLHARREGLSGRTPAARRKALLQGAAKRQAQLEYAMRAGPLIAVAPGNSADATVAMPYMSEMLDWIDRLDGRVQFQLCIAWDHHAAASHFMNRMAAGGHAALSASICSQIDDMLAPLRLDEIAMPCDSKELLFNRVLLINAEDELALDEAVGQIDALWPEGFRIKLTGPSPAVSFALVQLRTIEVHTLQAEAATLGLSLCSGENSVSAASLCALSAELQRRRRDLLLKGHDPAQLAYLMRICALDWPPGPMKRLTLFDVRREGHASPVSPVSLPAPERGPTERLA